VKAGKAVAGRSRRVRIGSERGYLIHVVLRRTVRHALARGRRPKVRIGIVVGGRVKQSSSFVLIGY
jgi:hypothetical protein